jgi:peptide/nickel transport system ATP-binding protein
MFPGEIEVAGRDVAHGERELTDFRGGEVAMIFQEPMTAMDPSSPSAARSPRRWSGTRASAAPPGWPARWSCWSWCRSPPRSAASTPIRTSCRAGLRQRAMIAVALACRPKLLLADEPTTALDATVQIQVLLLLRDLQERLGMGVIFVTHDLGVAGEIADRVAVMYAGRVVEDGPVAGLMSRPLHPYAQGLLGATVHRTCGASADHHPRAPPGLDVAPDRLRLRAALRHVHAACLEAVPPMNSPVPGRQARCTLVPDIALPCPGRSDALRRLI